MIKKMGIVLNWVFAAVYLISDLLLFSLQDASKNESKINLASVLESALVSNEEFEAWLTKSESMLEDEVSSFAIFDLQVIMDRRKELEVGLIMRNAF